MLGAVSLLTSACGSIPQDAQARGDTEDPFSTSLSGEAIHEDVTAAGLAFLRSDIVLQLQTLNVATDVVFALDNRYHFDDCNFSGATATIAAEQAAAVAELDPANDSPASMLAALEAFARSLHIIQDFYSHTNWVELGRTDLVNANVEPWSSFAPYGTVGGGGVIVVEGSAPAGVEVSRNADAAYPANADVQVQGAQAASGLISGTVDYELGNFCPPEVEMTHDELNKDRSTLADRTLQHQEARALATRQTSQEWCRLVAMTRSAYGEAGAARLMTWLATDAMPACCLE